MLSDRVKINPTLVAPPTADRLQVAEISHFYLIFRYLILSLSRSISLRLSHLNYILEKYNKDGMHRHESDSIKSRYRALYNTFVDFRWKC